MKSAKQLAAFCLALCVGQTFVGVLAAANPPEDVPDEGELKLITYNIAGLPIPAAFSKDGRNPWEDAKEIGRQVAETQYDVLAVQEDFGTYNQLRKALGAAFFTYNKGNVPAGDGVDIFSRFPLYNMKRVAWAESYGGITYGVTDEYTLKGFVHAVLELKPGVYIDVYDLHANANDSSDWQLPWDIETTAGKCRAKQFRQLSDYIQKNSADRAILIFGDFNTILWKVHDKLSENLLEPVGLKDTWAELFNNGNTRHDGSPDWNGGERIDRILYRSSETIELTVTEAGDKAFHNAEDRSLSDHSSWTATMHYTCKGTKEFPGTLQAPKPLSPVIKTWNFLFNFGRDFGLLLKELPVLLGVKENTK